MKNYAERHFAKSLSSIDGIFVFIENFFSTNGLGKADQFSVSLAIEEIFTNMVKYQPDSKRDILLTLEKENERLKVCLSDFNVDYFDIAGFPDINIDIPLKDRRNGGLGIHLARKMMDKIDYQYQNRTSKIIMIKVLENSDV